jgi:DNA polymerase-4
MTDWPRAIIHVDLDAFYASVEQLRHPELRGKPVLVGGGRDETGKLVLNRAVVSAASYEARAFGCRSAMPMWQALRLCPQAQVVPVDFVAYRAASAAVFSELRKITPLIEPLSLDEAFLDITGSQRVLGTPPEIAERLRQAIYNQTQLHASFGVASCKTVAKIASDHQKPQGMVVVTPGEEAAFLAPLPLRALPGLGPAGEKALSGLGISTLGQLAALPLDVVTRRIGDHAGRSVWQRAQGIDHAEVTIPGAPKSVSREETFGSDIDDLEPLLQRLRELSADVGGRLRHDRLAGRTVNLKFRYSDFTTLTRQHSLDAVTNADQTIAAAAITLFRNNWNGGKIRLLGVGLSNLQEAPQLELFGSQAKGAKLDFVLDEIRDRFGPQAARRGAAGSLHDRDFRGEDLRRPGGDNQD